MRRVARYATLGLDHWMFIGEWSGILCMALGADSIPVRSCLKVLILESAMRVMAVAALDQALIHSVVEGLRKCGLHIRMAGVAKPRLGDLEQARFRLRLMDAVATCAAHSSLAVG